MKNHADDPEKGFLTKSILTATAWELYQETLNLKMIWKIQKISTHFWIIYRRHDIDVDIISSKVRLRFLLQSSLELSESFRLIQSLNFRNPKILWNLNFSLDSWANFIEMRAKRCLFLGLGQSLTANQIIGKWFASN